MKKLTVLSITLLVFCATNVNSQNTNNLEGVWKMIYQRFETPDKIIELNQNSSLEVFVSFGDTLWEPYEFKNPSYKIFTDKYFSLSGIDNENKFSGHFGTYSYDGETYTEHIIYSDYESVIGKTIKMKSKMDGNNWTIEGILPIDYNLRIFSRFREFKFTETWQRVE